MIGVDPRRGSKPHFHEGYSISVFHQPSRIHCRGRVWSVRPNQLVLLEPFEVHGGHTGAEECPQDGIIIHPSAMRRLFGSDRPMMITNAVIDDPVLAERFSKALRSSREVDVERAILQVFRRHGKRQPVLRVPTGSPLGAQACERSIAAQASEAGLSRSHFSRKFASITGLSPRDHRRMQRIKVARRLIEEGLTLAEAATSSGFSDQAHLTRQMRELCGITPGALRRRPKW